MLPKFQPWAALLGGGGVQAVGLLRGDIPGDPTQRKGEALHGGHERAVVEPTAGREAAERLAQWQERGRGGASSTPQDRDAVGL